MHVNGAVVGVTFKSDEGDQLFGRSTGNEKVSFIFTQGQPLIGAFGYSGDSLIGGLSFIQYDFASDQCKSLLKES